MIWGIVAMVIAGILGMALIVIAPEGDVVIDETEVIAPTSIEREYTAYEDAYDDAWCEFTNLFNAMEYKRSANGRSMIRRPGDKSFKFVAKA